MIVPPRLMSTFPLKIMLSITLFLLLLTGSVHFPSVSLSPTPIPIQPASSSSETFAGSLRKWDALVGCDRFREKHNKVIPNQSAVPSLQPTGCDLDCERLKLKHVSILVKKWTWIPDNLDNLYPCSCGLSCLWTKSSVLADKPDAELFENHSPPAQRKAGEPIRVLIDLEPGRKRTGQEDIFISYHAGDDVQSTYAGSLFHNSRNYYVSDTKNRDTLIYWSSSRCLPQRDELAGKLLPLLPHHSFGKCLNNVGGQDKALTFYPKCAINNPPKWWDHLHCAMSHYKFVLAIENTFTESYLTEKLFYALDSGSVPIYFGAPNVMDFVPPHSIIDGSKFQSMEELASYVFKVANDPIAYAEYHAWRRCGVLGNYAKVRAMSLNTLPCRLCEAVSRRGGRNAGS
nr:PREDICTED: alpha-(1,4)-fucosyltransferase-like [Bemisia tabaci]